MLQLLCLILAAASATVPEVTANKVIANQYVDALLQGFPEFARHLGLDPLSLPSETVSFSKKVLLVTWRGSASYQGSLRGLATLHRSGDFLAGHEGTRGFVDGTSIALSNLKASYSGRAQFMRIAVSIGVGAHISSMRLRVRVSCDVSPGSVANLDHFSISHFSKIDVTVSGLGPLGWVLGSILSVVATTLRKLIVRAIEGPVRGILASQVRKVKFPNF